MTGIIRSVITRSGGQSRNRRRPSSGSLAVRTSYPCAESAARSTRVICDSSSITRILPGMSFFFQRKITSLWHGISENATGRYDSGGEEVDGRTRLCKTGSSLAGGHGRGGADHVFARLARRQLHHRGHGVSGAGGVVGHAGRNRSLDLHRGSLRHLLRLFLSASRAHLVAGGRAGVGGDGFLRAQLRGGQPACRSVRASRPCRRNSGRRTWGSFTPSARR